MAANEHNCEVLSQPSLQWTRQLIPCDIFLARSKAP